MISLVLIIIGLVLGFGLAKKISGSSGDILYSLFIYSPITYITTVGLYNDARELLAIAKLSEPLVKSFSKESVIKIKLDF